MLYISINRDTYQKANFHIFNEKTFWCCYVRKSQWWLTLPAFCLGVFLVAPGLFFLDGSLLHINPTQPSVSWTEIWGKYRVPLEVSAWTFLSLLLINYLPEVWLGIPCWNTTQCCVFSFFFFFASLSSLSALLSTPVHSRSISSLEMSSRGLGNTRLIVSRAIYCTALD